MIVLKSKWSGLAALLFTIAATLPAAAETLDRIVASVDGEPITLYELREYQAKQSKVIPNASQASDNEVLQALITEKLVAREILARGIRVRDEDIDRYIDRIKQQNHLDDDGLKKALAAQGMDYTKYREQIRKEIEKVQLLNREIRGKVNISPEDVHRYYEAHKKDYEQPGGVKLRQITLKLSQDAPDEIVKAVADRLSAIRTRVVKGGEDFAKVAKEVSEDPLAPEGGDLGEMQPEKLVPEFETAVAKLKDGEVSEPIRTSMGMHLVKLEKRIEVGYRPEEEVAADIKDKLYNEALDERYKRWLLEDIQKNHYVETKL
jgi:peptidyl-prolyl cis-trans isomerase SurA